MAERVKGWLAQGIEVRIVTARAWRADEEEISNIQDWLEKHIGQRLVVTCQKDYGMTQLWDDRAVSVVPNEGIAATEALEAQAKEQALEILSALGQAGDAHEAQLKAEAQLATARADALREALQAIANLPSPICLSIFEGHEQAYRAIEALFATPPAIFVSPVKEAALCDLEIKVLESVGGFGEPLDWGGLGRCLLGEPS
jgi:hypothetical protein